MILDLSSFDLKTILTIVIPAVITGVSAYYVGVKNWWKSMPEVEQEDVVDDVATIFADRKLSVSEVATFTKDHVIKK